MERLVTQDPLSAAEDAPADRVPWPNQERYDAGDVVLFHAPPTSPRNGRASRIRFDPSTADRRIEEVRAWFAGYGRDAFLWSVGASATPADLVERLRAHGATPHPREPVVTPLVLDHEPPSAPGVAVRQVDTFEDYRLAWEVDLAGSDAPAAIHEELLARLVEDWPYFRADAHQQAYLASLDGVVVAYGLLAIPLAGPPYLAGAATVPSARGRGAYRALVRRRWEDCVRRGTPILTAQAGDDARPTLERIGFRAGPPIHVLLDHAAGTAPVRSG